MTGTDDRERFAAQLRAQGEDDATVEAFVRIAERITSVAGGWVVRPKHVDEAIRRAEADGAQPHQLANLKRVGDALVGFARANSLPPPSTSAPTSTSTERPCPGCGGPIVLYRAGQEVGPARGIGGLLGAGGSFIAVRLFGCFGVLAFGLAVAACLSVYRFFTTYARCDKCWRKASLDEASVPVRAEVEAAHRTHLLGAAGFGVGAVVALVAYVALAVWAISTQPY